MIRHAAIQQALEEFATGLHLEEEELPTIFDAALLDAAHRVEEATGSPAMPLLEATGELLREPSADSMANVLHLFGALIVELNRHVHRNGVGAEWNFARQVADLAEHIAKPRPAENQEFTDLPRLLMETDWLQRRLAHAAHSAGVDLDRTPTARALDRAAGKRWLKRLARQPEGKLCATLDHLLGGVEYRTRQVWVLRRSEAEEQSLTQMYIFGHVDLFPQFHSPLSENSFALEVAKLKGLAHGLQLQDLAYCFDSADWIAQYALSFLLPPSPTHWPVRGLSGLDRLLAGRLSRWYFCAFDHRLAPLEMAATVLRTGRPLFYERVAAHALLEYSLLQGVPLTRASAGAYLEVQAGLEIEFQSLFDGFLLRLLHYPQLRNPEGWRDYLVALDALHYDGSPSDRFLDFRRQFLHRRSLESSIEILYRATESRSALN